MKLDIQQMSTIQLHTSSHVYVRPSIELQDCIAHYTWMSKDSVAKNESMIIVPDAAGCIVVSVYRHHIKATLWGVMTKTVPVCGDAKAPCDMFFIEFRPQGAYTLFQIPLHTICDQQLELSRVIPSLLHDLEAIFAMTSSFSQLIQHMNRLFTQLKKERELCVHAMRLRIHGAQGNMSIRDITQSYGYSERHLQRMFEQQIGCSIKTYARMERINQCISYMKEHSQVSLTQISQHFDYYDQSHFIYDFKLVCGMTPGQFREQLSLFYNEQFKF